MTLENAVELIFLRVNGGKPNPANAVKRVDIKAMLPAAVNYAMDKAYSLNLQTEGDRDYPSEFYSYFGGIPIDWSGNIPFIELSLGTVPLKSGAGLRFVYDNCQHLYSPIPDSEWANIRYYSNIAKGMYFFRRTGDKLYLYGLQFDPLIEELNYQAITKIEDLSPGDVLPIQAGQEEVIFELMANWFMNKMPINVKVNGNDINAQAV